MKIELKDIRKSFGAASVLKGVSLVIEPNELFFLLGPSGCGKTTLLRILAGFVAPDSGEVLFDGRSIGAFPSEKRSLPMVFQTYALWPHLSVFENVAYGLRIRRLAESEIQEQTMEILQMTKMEGFADALPGRLSGGQQQRIAISRALAVNPRAMLFDEPLSNLDARLRVEMRSEILSIHRRKPFTAVYVTHDQEEAMTMAHRIGVMHQGILHQVGLPHELYQRPANRFVAEFMGPINWLESRVQSLGDPLILETKLGAIHAVKPSFPIKTGEKLLAGFRPSAAEFSIGEGANRFSAELLDAQYAGSCQNLKARVLSGEAGRRLVPGDIEFQISETNPRRIRAKGEKFEFSVPADQIILVAS